MKQISDACLAFLNSNRQFYRAELYTFSLLNGLVLRLTEWKYSLTIGGNTWTPIGNSGGQPLIKRDKLSWKTGLNVDTFKLSIYAGTSVMANGVPIIESIQRGDFDGAQVLIERVYMPTAGDTSLGKVHLFGGIFSDSQSRRISADCTIKSGLALLDVNLPKRTIQPSCWNSVYDAGCTLDKEAFAKNTTALAGSTNLVINCGLTDPAGWYDLGWVKFTSGQNNGAQIKVRSYEPGALTLVIFAAYAPAPGDTLRVYPGCDGLMSTCSGKFDNLVNFGGQPFVPPPETAY